MKFFRNSLIVRNFAPEFRQATSLWVSNGACEY